MRSRPAFLRNEKEQRNAVPEDMPAQDVGWEQWDSRGAP